MPATQSRSRGSGQTAIAHRNASRSLKKREKSVADADVRQAREQYLSFLRERVTPIDYKAFFKNAKQRFIEKDGFDDKTAVRLANRCVKQLKASKASMVTHRQFIEHLVTSG